MAALGFGGRSVSALCCLTLLGAHATAFAQSSSAEAQPSAGPAAPAAPSAAVSPAPANPAVSPPEPGVAHASRLPAFIALGIGGVALGGAAITGIIAYADYNDEKSACSPACTNSELTPGRTMALTSTILTGVAIVGVGLGVTLLFTSGPDPEQTGWAPRLHLAAASGKADADATWRF
ncbi:MAG TPA: hypothetical protein VNW92_20565 [Polyangiaceae bacterium]|nr:hypothetical protein [Polyangiaceae bacterium]